MTDETNALAMEFAVSDWEAVVLRPHCIDCKGSGGGLVAPPVRGHDPETCHLRPSKPRWPEPKHLRYARIALDFDFDDYEQIKYDGPDPSVECSYPPCTNRLRQSIFMGNQWCSKAHREATE